MTPQQIEALKLALEALRVVTKEMMAIRDELAEYGEGRPITNGIHQLLWDSSFKAYTETAIPAYAALEKALADHAMQEVQRLGQEIEQEPVANDPLPRACNLAGVDYQTFLKIKAYMPVAPPQPERHELQAKGEHPAPCARHCEANAFQIVIKNLKAQLAQPEQEPVAYMSHSKKSFVSADDVGNSVPNWTDYYPTPLYAMPKPCPTCEALARTVMLDQTSHDTAPPQRTWVGLTDEERYLNDGRTEEEIEYARAIEAKLKEKNT